MVNYKIVVIKVQDIYIIYVTLWLAHSGPVRGVVINALSTTVISGGADRTVKVSRYIVML